MEIACFMPIDLLACAVVAGPMAFIALPVIAEPAKQPRRGIFRESPRSVKA